MESPINGLEDMLFNASAYLLPPNYDLVNTDKVLYETLNM